MGTGVDADRGTGSAAKAREPGVALLFRRASALALVGMAAFTDIVITRRRAGWPVRRVSVRSRITRQSPAYAPFVAFADVSVAPPTIASADTASRIRFITVSTPIGETRFCYRNFKFPELLRNHFAQAPSKSLMCFDFCQIFLDNFAHGGITPQASPSIVRQSDDLVLVVHTASIRKLSAAGCRNATNDRQRMIEPKCRNG